MTRPKGNSEFCFPETLNVPPRRGEAEGNIRAIYTWKISCSLHKPQLYIRSELDHLYERGLHKTQSACINGSWLIRDYMSRFCVCCHSSRGIV